MSPVDMICGLPTRIRYRWCKVCRKHDSEVGPISSRGKCANCADSRALANNAQISECRGPFFEHWRHQILAAFGVNE